MTMKYSKWHNNYNRKLLKIKKIRRVKKNKKKKIKKNKKKIKMKIIIKMNNNKTYRIFFHMYINHQLKNFLNYNGKLYKYKIELNYMIFSVQLKFHNTKSLNYFK